MKTGILIALALLSATASSEVRVNHATRMWEGNVCANEHGWAYVLWQPLGSFCQLRLLNGQVTQGRIINR